MDMGRNVSSDGIGSIASLLVHATPNSRSNGASRMDCDQVEAFPIAMGKNRSRDRFNGNFPIEEESTGPHTTPHQFRQ
jgi:hypothetical protein